MQYCGLGGMNREGAIRFALSAEEVGFLLNRLPEHKVEFARKVNSYNAITPGQITDDQPDKVMSISPLEGGQFQFHIDFYKDGVGGQCADASSLPLGPIDVTAQLGEWQVLRLLMEHSIPTLLGWDTQMNLAVQNSVQMALRGENSGGGPSPSPSGAY